MRNAPVIALVIALSAGLAAQQAAAPRLLGRHPLPVLAVAVSPDGATVASASGSTQDRELRGQVQVWDLASGALKRALMAPRGGMLYSLAFSPDGRLIAAGGMSGTATIWDAASGALQHELVSSGGPARALAFSPDGRSLAVAGLRSGELRVWDVGSGTELRTVQAHEGGVMALSWSSRGDLLATAGRDRTLKVWQAASGKLLSTIEGASDRSLAVAFAPDGLTLAIGGPDVMLAQLATGQVRTLGGHPNTVASLAFSADGQLLLSATGEPELVPGGVQKVAGLPEFQVAAADSSGSALTATRQGVVRVYDARDGTLVRELTAMTDFVWSAAFSPDARSVITGNADGTVRVWSLR